MSSPCTITAAFLNRILALLAPLFLSATGGDLAAASDAVRATLDSYNARTNEELRHAALIVAFGFGTLDALSKATNPDLSLNQVLRLRGNACALSRAGFRIQATLDKLHKQAGESPAAAPDLPAPAAGAPTAYTGDLPATTESDDLISFARSVMQGRNPPPLTRQQRRAAERAAEKSKRQQDFQARRGALLGPLATSQ